MLKSNKIKYKFVANAWITGFYNNLEVIGRSCIIDGEEMLSIINTDGESLFIGYQLIIEPNVIIINKVSAERKQFNDTLTEILSKQQIITNN